MTYRHTPRSSHARRVVGIALGLLMLTTPTAAGSPSDQPMVERWGWWSLAGSGEHGAPVETATVDDAELVSARQGYQLEKTSALWFDVSGYERPPASVILTLEEADASIDPTGFARLVACPARKAWEPAAAGAWNDRVRGDCSRGSVVRAHRDDEGRWTVDLTKIVTQWVLGLRPNHGIEVRTGRVVGDPSYQLGLALPEAGALSVRMPAETPARPAPLDPPASPAPDPGTEAPGGSSVDDVRNTVATAAARPTPRDPFPARSVGAASTDLEPAPVPDDRETSAVEASEEPEEPPENVFIAAASSRSASLPPAVVLFALLALGTTLAGVGWTRRRFEVVESDRG